MGEAQQRKPNSAIRKKISATLGRGTGDKRAWLVRRSREMSSIAEGRQVAIGGRLLKSLHSLDGNHVGGTGLVQRKTGGDSDKIATLNETQLD